MSRVYSTAYPGVRVRLLALRVLDTRVLDTFFRPAERSTCEALMLLSSFDLYALFRRGKTDLLVERLGFLGPAGLGWKKQLSSVNSL